MSQKAAIGRPTDYRPEYAKIVKKAAKFGVTDREIADILGVDVTAVYRWQLIYPEFQHAIQTGKAAFDSRVERSLANRAVGYTFESEKIFMHEGEPVRVPVREHVPPDVAAAFIWLKNRRPAEWRDRRELDISGSLDVIISVDLTPPIAKDITDQVVIEASASEGESG